MIKLMKLLDKHIHLKAQNQNLKMLKITCNLDSSSDWEWLSQADKIVEVKWSNMKYAANFPVTINKNNTISLFDTEATMSCISKACFDKLWLRPALVQTHTYKVNGANGNRLGLIGMTTCTLEFLQKFQQQFIVSKHLLWAVILGLDLSLNYLIRIDWFSTNQLHQHQDHHSIRPCTISSTC